MKFRIFGVIILLMLQSCMSKKEVLYLQDASKFEDTSVSFSEISIQPNDILKITVGSLVPEAALPYNKIVSGNMQNANLDLMKLQGYVVSNELTIDFPVLGTIDVTDKNIKDLATELKTLLEQGGHLNNPVVDVRLLNAKVTVLGEVKNPGTFNYTEANLTVLQALGMAGDLTINGEREDVLLVREVNGKRKITHINLRTSQWMNTDAYQIKPNDVIIVNPNTRVVKGAGVVDTGTFLAIASLTLSVVILLTR